MVDGSLHAGFGILPIRMRELLVRTIYEEPLVACIPAGHRLAARPALAQHDFDGEPIIAVSREPWPERHQEIEDFFGGFGVALRVVCDAYSASEALTYASLRSRGIDTCEKSTDATIRPSLLNPALSVIRLVKLRTKQTAPTTNTIEMAICAATNTFWSENLLRPADPP